MKKILSKGFWVDQDIEMPIGQLLRYGVVTASSIVLLGRFNVFDSAQQYAHALLTNFTGEADSFTTFKGIISNAWN